MDVFSHGLWGGIAFGQKSKKSYWLSFFIGIAPDIFSFGILFVSILFSRGRLRFTSGPPDPSLIPNYIDSLYNGTHSLIVFALVFFIVWLIFKRPVLELLAWGLHIIIDIFSHSLAFFATPFLWPISDYKVDAVSWGDPRIFFTNIALLIIIYILVFIIKRRNKIRE